MQDWPKQDFDCNKKEITNEKQREIITICLNVKPEYLGQLALLARVEKIGS